ncbi:MAG: Metallophosphoesterase [Atribacteria bacterium 34_128]|jgi:predicted phosphodiesterase|nr:MAG: Metallophosphoesterase [Atribacteria bacterium 34_128]
MKIGIISDIHSNSEAINCLLKTIEKIDEFICLGDIVGYGADPNYCIEKIKELNCRCIGGNHDFGVIGKLNINYFNYAARVAMLWTSRQLKKENLNFLIGLNKKIQLKNNVFAVHGSPQEPILEYILDKNTASLIFSKFNFKICFVGHSHLAGCFSFNENNNQIDYMSFSNGGYIEISKNKRYIINCGSVGQPRDGNPKASYGIYDLKYGIVNIYRVSYPIHLTQDKIIKAGLPKSSADRLTYGR